MVRISKMDREIICQMTNNDPVIMQAVDVVAKLTDDPRFMARFESKHKAIMDRNSDLYEAELRGKMKGKAEGETEKAHNVARAALMKGADVEFVAKITGLPLETIQKIKADLLS